MGSGKGNKMKKEKEVKQKKDKIKIGGSEIVEQIRNRAKEKIPERQSVGELVSTGIDLIDEVLCGGFLWGRIINIVGDSSTGKTFLTLETLAHIKKKLKNKVKIIYDDCEGGFSFDTKAMYGSEILTVPEHPSTTVEDFSVKFKKEVDGIKEGHYLIYVVDSWDGLSSQAERKRDTKRHTALSKGDSFDEGSYAMDKQKFSSEFFRLRAGEIVDKNVILIIISQVRDNIGVMFGEKHKRSGGKALDFYAYACIWLSVCDKHFKKERLVSITTKVKCKKAKVERPNRTALIDIVFDYGVDNIKSNLNFLYDLKDALGKDKVKEGKEKELKEGEVIKENKKAVLEWDGQKFSRAQLIRHIEENNLEAELSKRTREKWMEIENSISSKGRKSKWS